LVRTKGMFLSWIMFGYNCGCLVIETLRHVEHTHRQQQQMISPRLSSESPNDKCLLAYPTWRIPGDNSLGSKDGHLIAEEAAAAASEVALETAPLSLLTVARDNLMMADLLKRCRFFKKSSCCCWRRRICDFVRCLTGPDF
jgi:hypothetical protein